MVGVSGDVGLFRCSGGGEPPISGAKVGSMINLELTIFSMLRFRAYLTPLDDVLENCC